MRYKVALSLYDVPCTRVHRRYCTRSLFTMYTYMCVYCNTYIYIYRYVCACTCVYLYIYTILPARATTGSCGLYAVRVLYVQCTTLYVHSTLYMCAVRAHCVWCVVRACGGSKCASVSMHRCIVHQLYLYLCTHVHSTSYIVQGTLYE